MFLARRLWAGGKQAVGTTPSETTLFFFREKALVLSSCLGLRAGRSSLRQAGQAGQGQSKGRTRHLSLREERGLTHNFQGTVFCYFCFRGRWQERKGRRGKQVRKLAPEKQWCNPHWRGYHNMLLKTTGMFKGINQFTVSINIFLRGRCSSIHMRSWLPKYNSETTRQGKNHISLLRK